MRYVVAFLVLMSILVIACGSSDSDSLEPTESALREMADAYGTSVSNEKWVDLYQFYSPAFQENCQAGELATIQGMRFAGLKGLLGIDEDGKLEFNVTEVTVDGVNGSVTADVLYKGEIVAFGDQLGAVQWEFIDGQWKYVEDGDEGCPDLVG